MHYVKQQYNNERGAALWSVMLISVLILFIVTSSITYFVEHRRILHMRLEQIQAIELVKNGIVFIKAKIANNDPIETTTYTEHFANGWVRIKIAQADKITVHAVITGYTESERLQSYEVKIDRIDQKVTYFAKTVLGTE